MRDRHYNRPRTKDERQAKKAGRGRDRHLDWHMEYWRRQRGLSARADARGVIPPKSDAYQKAVEQYGLFPD